MTWIDNSLEVACPRCEANRGEQCVLISGDPALESHVERWGLAIDSGVKLTDLLNLLHRIGNRGLEVELNPEVEILRLM
jgi:hypothetical protein